MKLDWLRRRPSFPWTWDPEAGEELSRAVEFLDWTTPVATVVRVGYGVGLLAGASVVVLGLALPLRMPGLIPLGSLVAGLGATHVVHRCPVLLATLRRTRALGDAPGIVARAVLQMRIEPTVESAATFAARTGEGPLASSLATHVRDAAGAPDAGLARFGEHWSEWFPELRRATALVEAAANAPPGDRARTLDRAADAVLSGTAERMGSFASDVRGPATALYAFGVLLPMALVALLPAAGVAGVPVSFPVVVVAYDLLLPIIVAVAGGWLLLRRPVAFPPARVPCDHPERYSSPAIPVLAGTVAGCFSFVAASALLAGWLRPLVTVGVGIGATLMVAARPVVLVRRRVAAAESNLPDALYLIGRRVSSGTAVETAIPEAARELPGETGGVFERAGVVQRELRVGVEAAFLGEYGALAELPSTRLESAARLLAAAAREGQPAGRAVVDSADHLAELSAIEREARNDLANVTGTLRHTGSVFGPMVGGATVRLAEGMTTTALGATGFDPVDGGRTAAGSVADGVAGLDPAGLGLAVGAYVLVLSVLLTGLAVGLERGLDPALVAYRSGAALVTAAVVFAVSYVAAGLLI